VVGDASADGRSVGALPVVFPSVDAVSRKDLKRCLMRDQVAKARVMMPRPGERAVVCSIPEVWMEGRRRRSGETVSTVELGASQIDDPSRG